MFANSAHPGGLTATDATTSSVPAPADYFAFIPDLASKPHESTQQTIGRSYRSPYPKLQLQDLDTHWPIMPGMFRLA